eukprot:PhF_6_TR5677/c0_g1_i1/m.8361/K06901/pbuG; putative MFS transporter, AGZA family, xanthine/uracil permease
MTIVKLVERFFHMDERRTTLGVEIRAGVITFLTMSYILLVNMEVLTAWVNPEKGEDKLQDIRDEYMKNIATSTAIGCTIACILVGLVANVPFAIGPGMGLNTFMASSLVPVTLYANYSASREAWNVAVTANFVAGAIITFLAAINACSWIMHILPEVLKTAIMVGIGLYQAFIGMKSIKIVQGDSVELVKLVSTFDFSDHSSTGSSAQLLFIITLLLTAVLFKHEIKGSILVGIVVTTIICWSSGIGGVEVPNPPVSSPSLSLILWTLDFPLLFSNAHVKMLGNVIAMVFITIFDVGGVMFGVSSLMNLPKEVSTSHVINDTEEDNQGAVDLHGGGGAPKLPGRTTQLVFLCVGFMTMMSAALGCSANIVFLECAAGVAAGGRTGFASVVTGMLFFVSIFLSPVFRNVPSCASSPALVLIGALMMSGARRIEWDDFGKALPAFLTICMMPFTSEITPGIIFGLVTYIVMHTPAWCMELYRKFKPIPVERVHLTSNAPGLTMKTSVTTQRQSSFGTYPIGHSSPVDERYGGTFDPHSVASTSSNPKSRENQA